ncbi:MAG TPA: phosphate ABC transporter substrate-binding protein PstS [Bacteroidales bacterium]|nr:phosphate ABC transporter substrate-binding protein PstS [Bacteroidales bacterium]
MMRNLIILATILAITVSCNSGGNKSSADKNKVAITAAGATFPMPFYNLAIKKYTEDSGILLTYGGIGSGGGIRSLSDKVVDFGATDAFLSEKELSEMPAEIVHIPTCMGAVVIAYNLQGVDNLKITPEILEGVFLGSITKWNDPKIKTVNSGVNLPDMNISVVYRSDGSGTTYIFSDYMTKISQLWSQQVGTGKSLNWPVGMGAKGNPGVAGTISQSVGSIGYIGSEYAFAQKIQYALVQNSSGNFINPEIKTVSSSAKGQIPADTRIMVTNSADPDAYPISGFTWIILYKEQAYNKHSSSQAEATVHFLDWLISPDAQAIAESVNYASLPADAVTVAKNILGTITFEGKPILKD